MELCHPISLPITFPYNISLLDLEAGEVRLAKTLKVYYCSEDRMNDQKALTTTDRWMLQRPQQCQSHSWGSYHFGVNPGIYVFDSSYLFCCCFLFLFVCLFKTGFLCVTALAVLKLTL